MGCIITKKTPIQPFETHVGNPAKFIKPNEHRLENSSVEDISLGHNLYQQDLETMKKILQK